MIDPKTLTSWSDYVQAVLWARRANRRFELAGEEMAAAAGWKGAAELAVRDARAALDAEIAQQVALAAATEVAAVEE